MILQRRAILQLRLVLCGVYETLPPSEAKQIGGDLAHLDLLAALGYPVPPMVAPNMFEGIVSRVAIPAMDLYSAVCSLGAQSVGPVVAHGNLVADSPLDLVMRHRVHLQGSLANQLAQHLALCSKLHERELDTLVVAEGRAKRSAFVGVLDRLSDTVYGCAKRRCSLADAVLVDEGLGNAKAVVDRAECGALGHPDVLDGDGGMVGWHVQRPLHVSSGSSLASDWHSPFVGLGLQPWCVSWYDEAADALNIAVLPARARKDGAMGCVMHARLPLLVPVQQPPIDPAPPLCNTLGGHMCCIAAVARLRQAEGHSELAPQPRGNQLSLLLLRTEVHEHDDVREVAHHAVLVLQVVEQAQAFGGKMFADHGHPQVAPAAVLAVLPAILLWQGQAVEACFVREPARLGQQILPFLSWQAAGVPVCACVFAAVVEEAVVVVFVLQWEDGAFDEGIQVGEIFFEVVRDREVHGRRHDAVYVQP